ncbi:uncharacterized protein TrAFT101_009160 [Trichoderma asperellum]|uniref:uncharacterized protein n=1 Tax=Trichoderma asperellum TaxID=101201 RepID=UPI00331B0B43|nr:hypothetical protein TrAFT101_009160 [Trichoderma asperellum]
MKYQRLAQRQPGRINCWLKSRQPAALSINALKRQLSGEVNDRMPALHLLSACIMHMWLSLHELRIASDIWQ